MNFSLKSLDKYVGLKKFFHRPDELMKKLSFSGLEVQEWKDFSKKWDSLLIGLVKESKKHPSADRLTLCQVQIGAGGSPLSIVCGAKNFQVGDKVVVAKEGAILPNGLKIKKSTIRGEVSEAMMASFSELGLVPPAGEKEEGIIVLPKEAPVGKSFASHFDLDDVIFHLNIMPNRGDCLSHFGLARELSALLDKKLKIPSVKLKRKGESVKKHLSLKIKQKSLCARYCASAIYGVKIAPSPLWLKLHLESLGLKSINNVVDITNYMMIHWGQPLHAFDLDSLSKGIEVNFSIKKEKLKLLDGKELELTGEELCIRDQKGALALAGVMGGLPSSVQEKTTNIFLESACFDPVFIQKMSKKLGIETDSSYRFSRSVPPHMTLEVLQKASAMIQALAGGEISKDDYDLKTIPAWEKKHLCKAIEIKKKDLEERLGFSVDFKAFESLMKRLFCTLKKKGSNKVLVTPPFFRSDLHIKEDLIEEYARVIGYENIPEKIVQLNQVSLPDDSQYTMEKRLFRFLVQEGFYQVINHSFISEEYSNEFLGPDQNIYFEEFLATKLPEHVKIQNPLSSEHNMMRVSLLPSIFKNLEHNVHRGQLWGRLFEKGKVFKKSKDFYREESYLSFVAWGQSSDLWHKQEDRPCVYDLKAVLDSLMRYFSITDFSWRSMKKAPAFLHSGQCRVLFFKDQGIAYIGTLHPSYVEKYKIRTDTAIAELNMERLSSLSLNRKSFDAFSHFPQVQRDIALVMAKDFPAGDLLIDLRKWAGSICRSVKIFDVYDMSDEKRCVAFRFVLQSYKDTLTEEELKKWYDGLMEKVLSKKPVQLRSKASI